MINADKKFTSYPEGQKRRLPTDIWHVSWWLYDDGRFLPGLWISTKGISEMNRWVKIISSSSPILHSEKTKKIPKPPVRHWTANKTYFFSIDCKILKVANSLEIEITEQSLKWTNTRLTFFPFIHQPSRLQELRNSLRWPIYVINSGDKTKLSCYSPPFTQQQIFFKNLRTLL